MSKVKCESRVDAGATRIRGWHDYKDCVLTAKYKITYKDGTAKYVCGIHKRKAEYLNQFWHNIEKIESMTPTKQTPSECRHYGKRNFFEWLMDSFPHCKCPNKESGICICKRNFRVNCPNYQPKEKKYNDKD